MHRLALILVAVVACSGAAGNDVPEQAPSSTAAPAGTPATEASEPDPANGMDAGEISPPTSEQPTEPTDPEVSRPTAPDFTLELGEGGEYTLSEGERPVYLVFWAEW